MTDITPVVHQGVLIDVGARHGGRLVIETTVETARAVANAGLLGSGVELHQIGTASRLALLSFHPDNLWRPWAETWAEPQHASLAAAEASAKKIRAACDDDLRRRIAQHVINAFQGRDAQFAAMDRARTAEHQLATLARHVLDDDLVAARDYLTELGFGLEVDRG